MSAKPGTLNWGTDRAGRNELLSKLERLYGSRTVRRDAFGRRTALPSEIARVLDRARRARGR